MLTISTVLLYVFGLGRGVHGLRIHTGQIRWGGALKLLPVEPSVFWDMARPVELVDVAMAGPRMVKRLRF